MLPWARGSPKRDWVTWGGGGGRSTSDARFVIVLGHFFVAGVLAHSDTDVGGSVQPCGSTRLLFLLGH